MAALPPRRFASALLAASRILAVIALLAMPSVALAAPRDVLRDYNDNGRIDGCYEARDYQRALGLVDPDAEQYGAAVDAIRQAQIERVLQADGSCGTAGASAGGDDDGGGVPGALVVVLVVAGAAVVGGGAYWLSRRARAGTA